MNTTLRRITQIRKKQKRKRGGKRLEIIKAMHKGNTNIVRTYNTNHNITKIEVNEGCLFY